MKITKASSRTALRDIEALIAIEVVEQEEAGGRKHLLQAKPENCRTEGCRRQVGPAGWK
jgi:hypothetical protein